MKRAVAAALFGAVIYLKLCLPGFSEEFIPLLHRWLELEQVAIPLPAEAVAWLDWR